MKISCPHCGGRAAIMSRQNLSDSSADLYCACRDARSCGATFVMALGLKHTLNPPIKNTVDLAKAVVNAAERAGKTR
jgi:cell division protein ZapA